MATDLELVERIYEAAALPERWPGVLRALADRIDAVVGCFVWRDPGGSSFVPSLGSERLVEEYVGEGWAADPEYAAPLWRDLYPGFQTEADLRSREEIERLPFRTQFLAPRGLVAGIGTVLQGTADTGLQLAFEGIPSHRQARTAVTWLDMLRAPLGRALSLSALLRDERTALTVSALDRAGAGAAVVSGDGRLRAANDRFTARLGDRLTEHRTGLRFADRFVQRQFNEALANVAVDAGVRSIAVAATGDQPAFAIHLLPLRRDARDVIGWDGVLLLLAEPANASVPDADLLRLLFDLTPAEARLARQLMRGSSLAEAARATHVAETTARVHLRQIFAKTGTRRQAELMCLLLGLGSPN